MVWRGQLVFWADGGGWCLFLRGRCSMIFRPFTIALSFLLLVCPTIRAADVDMLMGNPSQASSDPSQKNNFLMNKDFFALSYNESTGTPN
jgi:hypothetical protein